MTVDTKILKMENLSLKEYTTLKIGGTAREVYLPSCMDEIYSLKEMFINSKICVIGAGSNLLISSAGINETVILTKNLTGYKLIDDITVKVECGLKSWDFAEILAQKDLSGLEFLVGIPGTIGGAVTMNSSAHGQAIEQVIENVEIIDLVTGEILSLNKDELCLEYRNSFVKKNRHLILNATFRLNKAKRESIRDKMNFHTDYRKKNHPSLSEFNAGSTFRNPEQGIYVGKLLQELGAKSWSEGGAKISEKHCNFIVNTGNATSLDVSRLMKRMHEDVKNKWGYDLIAEIRYAGEPTQEEKEIWATFTVH